MLRSDSVWETAELALGSANGLLFILACLLVLRVIIAYLLGRRLPANEAPCGGAYCQLTYAYPLRAPQEQAPVFESLSPRSRRCLGVAAIVGVSLSARVKCGAATAPRLRVLCSLCARGAQVESCKTLHDAPADLRAPGCRL